MLKTLHNLRAQGKHIGITFSAFDLLHAGHCVMLSECKEHCDFLIVGLQTDPTIDRPEKNSPVQSVFERWMQLQSNKDIDLVIPYETERDLVDLLYIVRPDVRFLGAEYTGTEFTGHELEIGLYFNMRNHSFSSSDLRERVLRAS